MWGTTLRRVVVPVSCLGLGLHMKNGAGGAQVAIPLLLDSGRSGTHCLILLPPEPVHHDGTVSQLNPSFLKLLLSECFITVVRSDHDIPFLSNFSRKHVSPRVSM